MKEKKNMRIEWLGLVVVVGIFLATCKMAAGPSEEEKKLQQEIASEILRFHVLANSDSKRDQQEKLEVRDAVVEAMEPILSDSKSREESCQKIMDHMDEIEKIAAEIASPHVIHASIVTDWFPEIAYGDATFPEGEYQALRIEIGEAKGHNWWCVLYPGLCFTDVVRPVMDEEGEKQLNQVLGEDACDFLLHPEKIKIRFRWF